MRRILDGLYLGSGILAAAFLVAICTIVLLQVGANVIDKVVKWVFGTPIGLVIPSYAEFAGFFLAATSFLALTYTLRYGAHIRVTLVIQHISGRRRRWLELWCIALAGSLAGYFAFYTIGLVLESYRFGDVSFGIVAVPLWIPQTAMALGLVILTIALVDEFVGVVTGRQASYRLAEEAGVGLALRRTVDAGSGPDRDS